MTVLALALLGEVPPRLRFATIEEMRDRHKDIEHTRVLPGTGRRAERFVQLQRIRPDELGRFSESQKLKVLRAGRTDVGQVGKTPNFLPDDFVWIHSS